MRPLEVIMLALTGLGGMNSSPLVARMDSTWAAAYEMISRLSGSHVTTSYLRIDRECRRIRIINPVA